ncbi:MAG: hypothetical protein ABJA79_08045 [Parafilimonas sp.]
MLTSFHVNTGDLENDFVEKLKKIFGDKKDIVITVEEEEDATWSLLSSEANRKNLKNQLHS